nr:MAG TPA: hypothetical protein [Caudoviricetes sp.]
MLLENLERQNLYGETTKYSLSLQILKESLYL